MAQAVGDAGGAPAGDSAPAGGAQPAWTEKLISDVETREFAVNKGYGKMTLEEAAPVAIQQYRNLERLVGAEKAGRTVEIPNWDQNDEAGVAARNAFYERIGVPKTAADYKLQIQIGGKEDPNLSNALAGLLHKNGVPARSAAELAKGYNEIRESQDAAKKAADTAKYAEQDKALKTEWGSKYDDNMKLAKSAAKAFGVTAEQLDAAQNTTDYLTTMKLFTQLASKIGEAQFIDGGAGSSDGTLTPSEAKVAIKSFMADPENRKGLMDKYHPKHAELMARKAQLAAWEVGQ